MGVARLESEKTTHGHGMFALFAALCAQFEPWVGTLRTILMVNRGYLEVASLLIGTTPRFEYLVEGSINVARKTNREKLYRKSGAVGLSQVRL